MKLKQVSTINDLLTNADVRDVLDNFIKNDLSDADALILIWRGRDGEINTAGAGIENYAEYLGLMTIAQHVEMQAFFEGDDGQNVG